MEFTFEGCNTFAILNGKKHVMIGTSFYEVATEEEFNTSLVNFMQQVFEVYGDAVKIRHNKTVWEGVNHDFDILDIKTGQRIDSEFYFSYREMYYGKGTLYRYQLPGGKLTSKWCPVSE